MNLGPHSGRDRGPCPIPNPFFLTMPRFAVLQHDCPSGVHWDLLLESGASLRPWSLPQPPEPGVDLPAKPLPDHRLTYLDCEGPISGGRGSVAAWDRGSLHIAWVGENEVVVEFFGAKLRGRAVLRKDEAGEEWRLVMA